VGDSPPSEPGTPPPSDRPLSLKGQIGATRDAAFRLAMAHVDLAKAEAAEIGGQIARVAALIGGALGLVIFAVILLVVGSSLFLSEWLLGSMGWGVLHGVLLFVGIALACVLLAVGFAGDRLGRAFALGAVVAVVISLLYGLGLTNQLFATIARNLFPNLDPANAPLVVGLAIGVLAGLVVGAVAAATVMRDSGGRATAVIGGIVAGAAIGAFSAISFQVQIGIGIGIAVGYLTWIALMAVDVARTGVDVEALQARFTPTKTIETSKETLEWLQKRMPPGIGS
jgi:hypothetical protein